MQNALKSNEWQRIWVDKTFIIQIQKGGPNNSDFLQNWFPPEIRSACLICRNFYSLTKKILWMIENTWKSNEWGRICILESFKIEIQKGLPNNSAVLQTSEVLGFSQEIKPPRFKQFSYSAKLVSHLIPGNWVPSWTWGNFRKLEKSKYFESCKIYYLEIYEEFGS